MPHANDNLDELRKRSHYLEVIHAFSLRLLQCESEEDIVWAIAKHAVARLGFVDCVVYLFDDAGEYLVQRAAHGPKNPIDFDINNPIKLQRGQGICGHVAMTGAAELIHDTSRDPRYQVDDDMRLSELAVPIKADKEVIGIIDSEHPDAGFYSQQDVEILTTIAAMASAKIVEARIQQRLLNHQAELEELVKIRTSELHLAVEQLTTFNGLLSESNRKNEALLTEIKASISYAKGIQSAILPSPRIVREYLNDSFILYLPKDIVAGDFYWMEVPESEEGEILFAVADCTGHGVPGAMISVVCNNALNRSVREFALRDPGNILNRTREIVQQEFAKSEEVLSDGMDIALCTLKGNVLQYAGAHNPLLLIRDGKLTEIKANKQPIGRFVHMEPFRTHTVYLQDGDCIYLFSDGFADQFGGPQGKKFKPGAFRDLLCAMSTEAMDRQREMLVQAFLEWKGELEQVDDVCVVGFRHTVHNR
jgi:serine phosphatase RsbU (regulator of sigma subunit)